MYVCACVGGRGATYVEKVVTGHTRLTGNTGGDDNNVGVLEGLSETTVSGEVAGHNRGGVDVRKVGGDTGGIDAVGIKSIWQSKRARFTPNVSLFSLQPYIVSAWGIQGAFKPVECNVVQVQQR